jgi:hypothetical protein
MSNERDEVAIENPNPEAAKALKVLWETIRSREGREAFVVRKRETFEDNRSRADEPDARYESIPDNTRAALEAMSVYELELLSDLNDRLVKDGLGLVVGGVVCGGIH